MSGSAECARGQGCGVDTRSDTVGWCSGSKRSTLDIEGKIAEWRERSAASAGAGAGAGAGDGVGAGAGTALLLEGRDVVCALLPPPALIDDLKTRLDAKDEDNESGIHESE
ncbi:unnamed protein product [Parnassius apollo]|uniref:(apollo) hypothetical protein n=1 Tax=Parnassius apollo TaxID=110799 RepID=A0A8S3XN40_PARAO|nr:unnamed protein product [Parnassius apollo]